MQRKIRMGMVGGGPGAFIGAVHRRAALMDGLIELVCGAFSSDPQRSREAGRELFLPQDRCYGDYRQMMEAEAALPAGQRMDFVAVVTPNHLHFPVALAALRAGFAVMCDKPLTSNIEDARKLVEAVEESGLLFGLTHNYTGYPMVKEARRLLGEGRLGRIRKVVVEYPQGWLSEPIERQGQKQADWRTDPDKAGPSGCMGDIGTHAENLAEYVTGLKIEKLCADVSSIVQGRALDDDGNVLLRLEGGVRGILYASQISAGEENGLRIRVYAEKAGLDWIQEDPNTLVVKWHGKPRQVLRAGADYEHLGRRTRFNCRLPSGHPEGFLEAFANLYRCFALTLACRLEGREPEADYLDFPGVEDGLRGMRFIEAVLRSSRSTRKWTPLQD
ncbi:MAG TPA: Gfo/Idh/MocA family oxidoreductase [Acidobacteriota bacterium]|nr:Gfo/Idh/MocA family oxidoreductase [Acidobacteriota bacterium]